MKIILYKRLELKKEKIFIFFSIQIINIQKLVGEHFCFVYILGVFININSKKIKPKNK